LRSLLGKAACHEDRSRIGARQRPTNATIVVVEGGQHLFEVPLAEQGD
jgi:hypothetical protein